MVELDVQLLQGQLRSRQEEDSSNKETKDKVKVLVHTFYHHTSYLLSMPYLNAFLIA